MDAPDPKVNAPKHVQSFMAKVKEFIESAGGNVTFTKLGPALPRVFYHHQATGAKRIAHDRCLQDFCRGRFGNS